MYVCVCEIASIGCLVWRSQKLLPYTPSIYHWWFNPRNVPSAGAHYSVILANSFNGIMVFIEFNLLTRSELRDLDTAHSFGCLKRGFGRFWIINASCFSFLIHNIYLWKKLFLLDFYYGNKKNLFVYYQIRVQSEYHVYEANWNSFAVNSVPNRISTIISFFKHANDQLITNKLMSHVQSKFTYLFLALKTKSVCVISLSQLATQPRAVNNS